MSLKYSLHVAYMVVQKHRTYTPILRPIDYVRSDASIQYTKVTAQEHIHLRAELLGSYPAHALVREIESYAQHRIGNTSTPGSDSPISTSARVEDCRIVDMPPPNEREYAVRTI